QCPSWHALLPQPGGPGVPQIVPAKVLNTGSPESVAPSARVHALERPATAAKNMRRALPLHVSPHCPSEVVKRHRQRLIVLRALDTSHVAVDIGPFEPKHITHPQAGSQREQHCRADVRRQFPQEFPNLLLCKPPHAASLI